MPLDSGTQFIGVSPDVNMQEKKSTLANSPTQVYTMTDISNYVIEASNPPVEEQVSIDSSKILAMGTTPIEILAAPGENNYYIVERITLEYTYGTTAYQFPTSPTFYLDGCFDSYIDRSLLTASTNTVCSISGNLRNTITVGSGSGSVKVITNKDLLDTNLIMSTTNSDDPTNGDGTLLVKIIYRIAKLG